MLLHEHTYVPHVNSETNHSHYLYYKSRMITMDVNEVPLELYNHYVFKHLVHTIKKGGRHEGSIEKVVNPASR